MGVDTKLLEWLRKTCSEYCYDVVAVYNRKGHHAYPMTVHSDEELASRLEDGGHFLPLPKEPAALANVLEVSIVDFLLKRLRDVPSAEWTRGSERGYPDLEIHGAAFGGGYHALDVKVARRTRKSASAKARKPSRVSKNTQSRITLF